MPDEQSLLGGSLVWIDRDAEVLHGAAGSERRKATFLEGQIAQDYIGGGGGYEQGGAITTQTRDCGGGRILPTDVGPGCGQSQCGPCIPPTEQVYCRTLTGILCTRFGPNCHTVLANQCQSVYAPCFTQNRSYCAESGFVGCNGPIDFTIYEQSGPQQFARQAGGGAQGFASGPLPLPTFVCPPPTVSISCQSRSVAGCFTRFPHECQLETAVRCVSRVIRCPTVSEPRCRISAVALCPDTVAGCQFESAACGFDPPGGGAAQAFKSPVNMTMPTLCEFCVVQTQTPDCGPTQVPMCAVVTRTPRCGGGGGGNIPTQFCVSHVVRCPSQLDACPTRYNCPTLPNGCPGETRFGACETYGACPSAVDACPSRFGCYETQLCGGGYGGGL